jgi:acetyltransferase-like isoleucine patch superfamily enzyme
MNLIVNRKVPGDWHDGIVPENVRIAEAAHLETSYSFLLYRSGLPEGVRIGRGSTVYLGCMFDVGPRGRVSIGNFSLINGAWFICDARIEIGDYALISWNVVFMDNYRAAINSKQRRRQVQQVPIAQPRRLLAESPAKPIRVGRNVWVGFDSCVLPGVTIGDGSIVGARSVVAGDVPPFTFVAGNPARVIRKIENDEHVQTGQG